MPRVAIIEDEALIALSYKMILERNGYEVCHSSRNGDELLERINDIAPDILIMDLQLGAGRNGLELAKKLREKSILPILFATGNSRLETAVKLEGMPSVVLRSKPVEKKSLLEGLEELQGQS